MKANCFYCGKEFDCKGAEKYCSVDCKKEARKKRDNSWNADPKICPHCKKTFYPKHRNDQIFCSEKCREQNKWELKKKPLEERTCPICEVVFMPTTGKQVCCSSKCGFRKIYLENPDKHKQRAKEWRQNNPERARENDRIKKEHNKERYRQYEIDSHDKLRFGGNRQKALERDGYKCVVCGEVEGIGVHHKDFSGQGDNPNNELDNLMTVCKPCHTEIHKPTRFKESHMETVKCQQCGKEMQEMISRIADNRGKYCSKECVDKAKITKINMNCEHCGIEFQVTPSRAKRGKVKYCSMECRKAAGYAWTGKK